MEAARSCLPHHKGCTASSCEKVARNAAAKIGTKRPDIAGERHPLWKGGVTTPNMLVRRSDAYRRWRTAVFERDDYRCVRCGDIGDIEANHIKSFADHPDLRLDVDNGETLCKPCHRGTPRLVRAPRFSPEHRQKMSEAAKRRWAAAKNLPNRRKTAEHRQRISASKKGTPAWNKGLTKADHVGLASVAEKARTRMTGKLGPESPVWKRWHPDHVTATPRQDPE